MDKNRWIKRFLFVVIFGFVIGLQFGCIKEEFDEYGYYKEVNLDYVSNQNEGANVKNIILIIGDGMGENQVKLTEKYGLKGSQALDILKAEYKGLIDTNCLNNYVTDSAAAATAMATGVRTLYERVGMDEEGNELKTILDYAYENNMGTGLLTTDNLDGATPLAFSSHGTNRYLNKEDMIKKQFDSNIDLLMGWGEADYYEFQDVITSKGYDYTNNKELLLKSKSEKIFACFSTSSKLQDKMPTLPEMTKKAIDTLKKNENGFVLVVEEGLIDKRCDAGDITGTMEKVINLDKTLRVCLNFMRSNDETIVIVLADHETGGLVLGDGEPSVDWFTSEDRYHTSVKVPVYAFGTRSSVFDNCDILNKDVFDIMLELLGIEK